MARKTRRHRISRKTLQKARLFTGLILVALGIYYLFFNQYGFVHHFRLRKEIRRLNAQIEALEKQQAEIKQTIQKLTSDYSYIEKIARERYQLKKKGEEIYILKPTPR